MNSLNYAPAFTDIPLLHLLFPNTPCSCQAMPGLCEEMDEDIFRRLRSHLEERNVDFLEKVQLEKIDRLESNNTLKVCNN